MTDAKPTTTVPAPFRFLRAANTLLSENFLGGPKWLKFAWVINAQKCTTLLFVGALMIIYDNFSVAAWTYLALHGSYGLIWLIKHWAFRDPGWEKRITFGGAVNSWLLVLGLYWLFPVLLITPLLGDAKPADPEPWLLALCIGLHTLGVVIMMAADCQKYFMLKLRPGLITTGMFARCRHPNYLGEMMLYGAYGLLVQHWIPWIILGWIWLGIFLTNIVHKEASMSRYPEWADYKRRSWLLLPRPW